MGIRGSFERVNYLSEFAQKGKERKEGWRGVLVAIKEKKSLKRERN